MEAKQVTITPVRGSAWFLSLTELRHLAIQGDSLFIIRNAGDTCAREALVDVRKIGVEEEKPTEIQALPFPITGRSETGRKVLEPDGQIVILRDRKKYGIGGLRIEE